ncbi:MAG: hypothetical protein ABR567_22170 [Myxococcales bacterium]
MNGGVAFWTWNDQSPRNGHGLFRANADGTACTPLETSGDSTWSATHADANAVYYFHGGALFARPR